MPHTVTAKYLTSGDPDAVAGAIRDAIDEHAPVRWTWNDPVGDGWTQVSVRYLAGNEPEIESLAAAGLLAALHVAPTERAGMVE